MTELRNQLDQMRDAYRGERYGGDLATEILAPARKLPLVPLAMAASLLAAIVAAVVVYTAYVPMTPNRGDDVAIATPTMEFSAMPEFPSDVSFVPSAESLSEIGGLPEFPAIDLNFVTEDESQPSEELS